MDVGCLFRRMRAEIAGLTGSRARAMKRLDGRRAVILMYHRVLPVSEARRLSVEPGMYVTPETFALHLEILRDSFRVLPLGEIRDRLAAGRQLPRGACAITFDDGWLDNLTYALPELERAQTPATIFVVTDRVGTIGAFWPDDVCRLLRKISRDRLRSFCAEIGAATDHPRDAILARLKEMEPHERGEEIERLRQAVAALGTCAAQPVETELANWEQLGALVGRGIDIESHGASHEILTTITPDRVADELGRSRTMLVERGFGGRGLLAYPSGAFNLTVVNSARACGYVAAVTTQRGLVDRGLDALAWPRIGIHDDVSRSKSEFLYRVPGAPE